MADIAKYFETVLASLSYYVEYISDMGDSKVGVIGSGIRSGPVGSQSRDILMLFPDERGVAGAGQPESHHTEQVCITNKTFTKIKKVKLGTLFL